MSARQPISAGLVVLCLFVALFIVARQPAEMPGRLPVIVDTDAGVDDMMAISYLLGRPEIDIQLITTVNGIAHAEAGARNVSRLLRMGNRRIPVYVGQDQPLEGRDEFPAEWRRQADEMTPLPQARARQPRPDGVGALLSRLRGGEGPVTLLALGPLTNIAEAVNREPRTIGRIAQLIVMGGAIDVDGNVVAENTAGVAEWNMFIDPTAASIVFRAGLPMLLVPLDATNHVPIDRDFVHSFTAHRRPPLGRVVGRLLDSSREMIDAHSYFAWDPLAAVAVVEPSVLKTSPMNVAVIRGGEERGRTVARDGDPNAEVAYSASAAAFRHAFLSVLTQRR